jgi:uncharacterized membrane protein YeaQ/YmgE (transglycosylase-associated protein family)
VRKKVAISITLAGVAMVYLFLLVALPALAGTLSIICDSEVINTPMAMYFVPGVIGAFIIIAIWKSKKETKDE